MRCGFGASSALNEFKEVVLSVGASTSLFMKLDVWGHMILGVNRVLLTLGFQLKWEVS